MLSKKIPYKKCINLALHSFIHLWKLLPKVKDYILTLSFIIDFEGNYNSMNGLFESTTTQKPLMDHGIFHELFKAYFFENVFIFSSTIFKKTFF